MGLDELQNGINSGIGEIAQFITEKPLTTAAIGAGVVGAGVGVAIIASSRKKSKRKAGKRGHKRDRKFKSKQKHEQKYKRKRKYKIYGRKGYINPKKKKNNSKRRGKIHYARKTGQPYILLANGKAKFIKGKRRKN